MSMYESNTSGHGSGNWHDGVSLQRWRLDNFKSVQHADIQLSPLTLLVGANSAGKSSLLQSILAVSQAVTAIGDKFPLNGGTVRLGTVLQNRYAGPSESAPTTICLGAHFQIGERAERRTTMAYRRRLVQQRRGYLHTHVDWNVVLGDSPENQSGHALIQGLGVTVTQEFPDQADLFDGLLDGAELHADAVEVARKGAEGDARPHRTFSGVWRSGSEERNLTDVVLRGGLPMAGWVLKERSAVLWQAWRNAYLQVVNRAGTARTKGGRGELPPEKLRERIVDDVMAALAEHEDELQGDFDFDTVMSVAFRERYAEPPREMADTNLLYSPDFAAGVIADLAGRGISGLVPTPTDLDDISPHVSLIIDFLRNNVRYLGPLREDPRVVYQDSPEAGNGYVGAKGEFCAAVLQNSGANLIQAPLPGRELGTTARVRLSWAVDAWARYLEIGEGVSTTDQGRLGLELRVRQQDVGIPLDLTSVGTGVSQILPVLVMCLQAPIGSLLMIEQPELHLNPLVQQRLADFLLAVTASGRQLIVETHSEYLISRLRLRVAMDETERVWRTVGLLFAERTNGSTSFRQVETNEFGGLENWPANFFDQSAEEAQNILRAAVSKRRAQQTQTPSLETHSPD